MAVLIATSTFAGDVPARKDAVLVSVTATVTALDLKTREVTLKGPLGNSITFIAAPEVKRLNEVQVGDLVNADYYISFVAELREPTAEEKEKPLSVSDDTLRATTDTAPAGLNARQIKAVVTIEGVDRSTQTITVKGPLGRYLTARVADPTKLEQMRIGQT